MNPSHAETDIAWKPDEEWLRTANVSRLARRVEATDHEGLLAFSVAEPAAFWDAVVADLEVEFEKPYDEILDVSRGIEWPRWFSGGTLNLAATCVARHASARPTETALVEEGEDGEVVSLDYAALHDRVAAAAAGLRALGIGPGDRVGLFLPLGIDAVVGLYATIYLGAVAVPMFSGFNVGAVVERLDGAGCDVLLTAQFASRRGRPVPMAEIAVAAAAAAGREVTVVARAGAAGELEATALDWATALEGSERVEPVMVAAETPALIMYTSGTTGRPKGSVHVHGGFLVKVGAEVGYHLDVKPYDVVQWTTDLGWILGPWHLIGAHLPGAAVILYPGAPDFPAPDRLWRVLASHRVSVMGVSPTLVRALSAHGPELPAAHDLTALRVLGSTGEPWDASSYAWLAEHVGGGRCPIINLSGGTEVGACFLGQYPVEPTRSCSLGGPSLGMAVDVYDADGHSVRGEMGELVCTAPWPSQTRGFLDDPTRYMEAYWSRWPGVWAHGDWASVDADGFWFLHGRSDDTLKIAGKRLGPAEVEQAALSVPTVTECMAIGVPDEVKGEAIWCLAIAPEADPEAIEAEVRAAVATALGPAFRPVRVLLVSDLPRTRSGKLVRRLGRDAVLGRDPGDASGVANPEALRELQGAAG